MNKDYIAKIVYDRMKNDPQFYHIADYGRNPFVPGEGIRNLSVLIIGDTPSAYDAIRRRVFMDRPGIVLRDLMTTAGLRTEDSHDDGLDSPPTAGANCWLTNLIKWRLPTNRMPSVKEVKAFRPWLRLEWLAIGCPPIIVPLGPVALTAVMGFANALPATGGMWKHRAKDGRTIGVWPMLHPAYGLRNPEAQPRMEQSWKALGAWLANR